MNSQEQIHEKGFNMLYGRDSIENYNKIKVGVKNLDDAILNLGSLKTATQNHPFLSKSAICRALIEKDLPTLRAISNFYYNISGIYERICNYFATLYRYDWYVAPEIYDENVKEEKVLLDFSKILNVLDGSYIKKTCGDIALEVIKNGVYYGYIVSGPSGIQLQQLPNGFCRSRYFVNGLPAVEFNMRFFDTIKDVNYRLKVLNLFPNEFKKGYMLYKQHKLVSDSFGDSDGWYLLEPTNCVKFNFFNSDIPVFVNAIPALIDLDQAQDLDRRKQMQTLMKILIQKLPLDKNGDLIFDIDEARDIHNNAVQMLSRAVGVDVVTTFADVDAINLTDRTTTTTTDDLEKVERSLYNQFGVSENLFNTDGNLALEKSVAIDESNVRNLLLQFEIFYDRIIQTAGHNRKKYNFKFYMLETTQFNYKEISKLYKEQTQIGYSKMLPQIALGHSQSFILNTATFENNILHLSEIMIPPLMSSTMSSSDILNKISENESTVGRPAKAEDEKSDKTLANEESQS